MPPLLEIEQKFSFNLATLPALLRKAAGASGGVFSPRLKTTTFHDTYYDSGNKLSSAGLWLRKRRHLVNTKKDPSIFPFSSVVGIINDKYPGGITIATTDDKGEEGEKEEWEAKQRVQGGSFLRSTFSEIKDRGQIAELVGMHFPDRREDRGGGFGDGFGLDVIAGFETERVTLMMAEEEEDDRFTVVLDVTDFGHEVGEVEVMAEDADKAHADIEAFFEKYPWFFDTSKPKGKLTAYFEKFGYPRSEEA